VRAPHYFASPEAFREWLEAHHEAATELVVGYYKVGTGRPSMTWAQSVDEALCFGWIDGIRHRVDDARYTIRFTPRKPTSIWSAVNVRRVEELVKEGRMRPSGMAAFSRRRDNRSGAYSYEQRRDTFDEPYLSTFRKARGAYTFFAAQPPSYRKALIWYVMSARQEATRERRLVRLIEASRQKQRIGMMERPAPRPKRPRAQR